MKKRLLSIILGICCVAGCCSMFGCSSEPEDPNGGANHAIELPPTAQTTRIVNGVEYTFDGDTYEGYYVDAGDLENGNYVSSAEGYTVGRAATLRDNPDELVYDDIILNPVDGNIKVSERTMGVRLKIKFNGRIHRGEIRFCFGSTSIRFGLHDDPDYLYLEAYNYATDGKGGSSLQPIVPVSPYNGTAACLIDDFFTDTDPAEDGAYREMLGFSEIKISRIKCIGREGYWLKFEMTRPDSEELITLYDGFVEGSMGDYDGIGIMNGAVSGESITVLRGDANAKGRGTEPTFAVDTIVETPPITIE